MKYGIGDVVTCTTEYYGTVANPCCVKDRIVGYDENMYLLEDCTGRLWWIYESEMMCANPECEICKGPTCSNAGFSSPPDMGRAPDGMFEDVTWPDEEQYTEALEVSEQGGKGSYTGTRMDYIPPKAIIEVGKVMYEGAQKYERDNWKKVSVDSHINHAIKHMYEYLDKGEFDDITHACTRLMMTIELLKEGK